MSFLPSKVTYSQMPGICTRTSLGMGGEHHPAYHSFFHTSNFLLPPSICTSYSLCLENSLPQCCISEWRWDPFCNTCYELFKDTCHKDVPKNTTCHLHCGIKLKRNFSPSLFSCLASSVFLPPRLGHTSLYTFPQHPALFLHNSHPICVQQSSDCQVPEGSLV